MKSILRFSLLEIPIEIEVEVSTEGATYPDPVEILNACYALPLGWATQASEVGSGKVIHASLVRRGGGEGWRGQVEGRPETGAADSIEAVRGLNHELLHAIMRRATRYFYVHAGVVAVANRVLVLPGLSQAGKSTLVLGLVLRGASFFSDELLVYDRATNTVAPFPRSLKLREVCLAYYPGMREQTVGVGEGRFVLPSAFPRSESSRAAADERFAVAGIIAPRWERSDQCQLTSISRGEAFLHLTESALNFGTHREASLDHLTAIVRDASCYRLSWSEPHAAIDRIWEAFA